MSIRENSGLHCPVELKQPVTQSPLLVTQTLLRVMRYRKALGKATIPYRKATRDFKQAYYAVLTPFSSLLDFGGCSHMS